MRHLPPVIMPTPVKKWFNNHSVYHIWCPVGCVVLVLLNIIILDYYLIRHSEDIHTLWFLADFSVFLLFCFAFYKSYKYFKQDRGDTPDPTGRQFYIGNLPLSYISWFFFSLVMAAKVTFIYKLPNSIVSKVEQCKLTPIECKFFGSNTLSTVISLAAVIFQLLVSSHVDVGVSTADNDFTQRMVGLAHLDILDTTQFLDAIREDSIAMFDATVNATLDATVDATDSATINVTVNAKVYMYVYRTGQVFSFINYIMPTEALFILAWSRSGFSPKNKNFKFAYSFVYYLIVNVPVLSIRITIWRLLDKDISVFIVKNIMAMVAPLWLLLEYCFGDSTCAHEENGSSFPESETTEESRLLSQMQRSYSSGEVGHERIA